MSPWPCLLHPSCWHGQVKGEVKEPTLLFEKGRGYCFPGGVVHLAHIIHIMDWVSYSKPLYADVQAYC